MDLVKLQQAKHITNSRDATTETPGRTMLDVHYQRYIVEKDRAINSGLCSDLIAEDGIPRFNYEECQGNNPRFLEFI
jgi:hypothetical protein